MMPDNIVTLPGLAPRIPKPRLRTFDELEDAAKITGLLLSHEELAARSIMSIFAVNGKRAALDVLDRIRGIVETKL